MTTDWLGGPATSDNHQRTGPTISLSIRPRDSLRSLNGGQKQQCEQKNKAFHGLVTTLVTSSTDGQTNRISAAAFFIQAFCVSSGLRGQSGR